MTTLYNILIAFISGMLIQLLILYLKNRYLETISKPIFTEGISTETITFTEDYQKILSSKIEPHDNFLIATDKTYKLFLLLQWSMFDIKEWLESLEERDYVLTIEIFPHDLDSPKIILTKEFFVNNKSTPLLIHDLIKNQLNSLYDSFNIDCCENHIILIHYASIKAVY